METKEMQALLFEILPQWHFRIARPLKKLLDQGISLEMYYGIRLLREQGDLATMSEIGRRMHMPKQHMTKLADRLVERGFAQRVSDPQDRRIVRLRITDAAQEYADRFLEENGACFDELFESMPQEDRDSFARALTEINRIFRSLPAKGLCAASCGENENGKEEEKTLC